MAADRLWRGPALPEVRELDAFRGLASRLEERRLVAFEDRFEAELLVGRHELVAGELAEAVIAHPFREVLRAQLALALYRSGRQAEALRSISSARSTFARGARHRPRRRAATDWRWRSSITIPRSTWCRRRRRRARSVAGTLMARRARRRRRPSSAGGPSSTCSRRHSTTPVTGHTTVVIEGAAGIGKTRLVEEFASDARQAGVPVAWGSCYEGSAAPSWWPWLAILRSVVDAEPATASAELDRLLRPSADEQHRRVAGPAVRAARGGPRRR